MMTGNMRLLVMFQEKRNTTCFHIVGSLISFMFYSWTALRDSSDFVADIESFPVLHGENKASDCWPWAGMNT